MKINCILKYFDSGSINSFTNKSKTKDSRRPILRCLKIGFIFSKYDYGRTISKISFTNS